MSFKSQQFAAAGRAAADNGLLLTTPLAIG
jgi:hypothetical protein